MPHATGVGVCPASFFAYTKSNSLGVKCGAMAGAERKGQELGCGKWMLACAAGKATARQNTKGPLPGASEKNAHPSRSLARQRPPRTPQDQCWACVPKHGCAKMSVFSHRFHPPQAEQVNIEIGGAKGALTTTALNQ